MTDDEIRAVWNQVMYDAGEPKNTVTPTRGTFAPVLQFARALLAAERERCAAIADTFTCGTCGMDGKCAAAIRALPTSA